MTIYVALLRGINVGGNNKVEMALLKIMFEQLGYKRVKTYINSGNIIFASSQKDPHEIAVIVEEAILKEFGLTIKVLIRTQAQIDATCAALKDDWINGEDMKCDVMFLWGEYDNPKALEQVGLKREIADVLYIPGAIIWRIDRKYITRGGADKLIGSAIYKHMTIRNCNTVRKLRKLMQEATTA